MNISGIDILTSEDVKSYKPRPELFLEALRRNNVKPDEVIHIGDSITSDGRGTVTRCFPVFFVSVQSI
jgi:HAD superfamily hydrolase (TIGR01549 family)